MNFRLRAGLTGLTALLFVFLGCRSAYVSQHAPAGIAIKEEYAALLQGGKPGVLRLHVIANSDSDEDQRIKLAVRDALLKRFAPAGTLTKAEEILLSDGAALQEAVDEVLWENGCGYGGELRLGVAQFPDRTYKDAEYPAGEYEALRVVLGSGEGQNWWCVLFPPLCLIKEGVEDIPGTDEIVFESWFLKQKR